MQCSAHLKEGEKRKVSIAWSEKDSLFLKKLKEDDNLSWNKISESFEGGTARASRMHYSDHFKEGEKRASDLVKRGFFVIRSLSFCFFLAGMEEQYRQILIVLEGAGQIEIFKKQ